MARANIYTRNASKAEPSHMWAGRLDVAEMIKMMECYGDDKDDGMLRR